MVKKFVTNFWKSPLCHTLLNGCVISKKIPIFTLRDDEIASWKV